ncbi:MAG TPA: class I adenylate-forming enzyme family protein [Solirubrobacteraceae bacterium]|nr:class I adenylate-forming enzyme family protein [Solirubrobacteraceae bacterium]
MPYLSSSLREACERWPERPALTHRGRTLTFAQLWERILALSWSYRSLGIRPGDRVLCQLPVSPEHVIAVGAAWACGAIHVGADKDLTGPELSALVARTGATALLYAPPGGAADPLGPLRMVRAAHPSLVAIVDGHDPEEDEHALSRLLSAAPAGDGPPEPSGPADAGLLLLTSGTTARPKLVVETLPALWGKLELFAGQLTPEPDDVHLMYLPVCHVFGLKLTLMALASGGRVVTLDRFSPSAALRLAREEEVTVLSGTPTHLTLLLRHLERRPDALARVRAIAFAAAPPPPVLIGDLYARVGARLMHVYGCSEGFITLTTERDEICRGAAGRTVFRGPPGTPPTGTVAILDPGGAEFLEPGAVGEIAYGTAAPVRYWDQPDAGAGGWYRTGDLGWIDGDGCLTVSGRLKDVVNRGGLKVACAEIEAVLAGQPGVAEGAITAVADPVLGEAICACVVPAGSRSPSLAEIREGLGERLARHKLPDELVLLDALPRTRMGKIDRQALSALAREAERARERLRPADRAVTATVQ